MSSEKLKTIKMYTKVLVMLMAVSLMPMVLSRSRRYSKSQGNSLYKIRCDLKCIDLEKEDKHICKAQCRLNENKPGTCPISDSPKWEAACVEACNADSQCDGTQRCCRHSCGSTCSEPTDLLTIPGLPALPTIEEPKEKKRSVVIRWSDGVGDAARAVPGPVFYVLEEQHHLGPKYEEMRLGEWNLLLRTNKTKVSLRNALKPGRWYRFRVAAVSSSGTRGFSAPSSPFTPRRGPRPPPSPKKLKVRPVRENNGTVTVRLEWKEPHSDLPVLRYKVFWSRRVKGLGGELDSVLVNHQTVPKDQNYIEIKDLQPNSMYFLQVQTISQFGLGKLRSDKASIFYNTTSTGRFESPPEPLQKRDSKKIRGLSLHKIVWYNGKIKARIAWQPLLSVYEQPGRYYVHWKAIKCHNPKKIHREGLTAITEDTTFELYELNYRCIYKVNVNSTPRLKTPDSELTVTVPACEYFKRRVGNTTVVNCDEHN
ncbi:anosmin-1-like [Spodoptera litura]|uniref:Anosmin-1-like n=1 Tax=Spodoptera litura TaxID=69820 RepID=A0A9J7ED39_SPOLT|nr:anosmin-1-like [Spodoptera litura]XP_022825827.1 anosmin-1-like [Spodoptera litura]XP_022825828.1 anosmin-1-like [Spodoptera litura]XP_022825829.1 anosmin-1-like [Spodoptera litura]